MSRINFEHFRAERPELDAVWIDLERWIENHPNVPVLDPKSLARDLYPVAAWDLLQALTLLANEGVLRPIVMVRAPNGVLLGEEFSRTEDVPQRLPDRTYENYFKVKPENIISAYRIDKLQPSP
jgi:hypothetical protein